MSCHLGVYTISDIDIVVDSPGVYFGSIRGVHHISQLCSTQSFQQQDNQFITAPSTRVHRSQQKIPQGGSERLTVTTLNQERAHSFQGSSYHAQDSPSCSQSKEK